MSLLDVAKNPTVYVDLAMMEEDRVLFLPRHEGDHVLPCGPLFNTLLSHAHRPGRPIAIKDCNADIEWSYAELLSAVVHLRNHLKACLPSSTLEDLRVGKEVYITLLAPGGYEFAAGALAILAIGAAISPVSPVQPVREVSHYVKRARSVALLSSRSAYEKGKAVVNAVGHKNPQGLLHIPISTIFKQPPIEPTRLQISSTNASISTRPGLVIFTSGTTGPPKGAILRLGAITDTANVWAAQKNLQPSDTLLHLLPVHHATGIWVSFFPFILSGACIEFRSGPFEPSWTWSRWRRGGLTHFSGVPTIYMRMMNYYNQNITKLPKQERAEYDAAARNLKVCMCGTSALPRPIDQFWAKLLARRIVQRYGTSELFVVLETTLHDGDEVPDGSVGRVMPGVDLRLVDDNGGVGTEGEIRVRSPYMFSKYLNDSAATRAAHDEEGYFKSGDIARREGDFYFIVGRASVDIIKSGGYKISALDVEREILALPYVAEVMVVGVPDEEFGQRVGAVISLRDDESNEQFFDETGRRGPALDLHALRDDLRPKIAGYKLPTLLRVIQGEIPKSTTGKVVKKVLGPQYFPDECSNSPEVQIWNNNMTPKPKL